MLSADAFAFPFLLGNGGGLHSSSFRLRSGLEERSVVVIAKGLRMSAGKAAVAGGDANGERSTKSAPTPEE